MFPASRFVTFVPIGPVLSATRASSALTDGVGVGVAVGDGEGVGVGVALTVGAETNGGGGEIICWVKGWFDDNCLELATAV